MTSFPPWRRSSTYDTGDRVSHQGGLWLAVAPSTGVHPESLAPEWIDWPIRNAPTLPPPAPTGGGVLLIDQFRTMTPLDLSDGIALHPFADWTVYEQSGGALTTAGITTPDGVSFDASDDGFYLTDLNVIFSGFTINNPPDPRVLHADDNFWMAEDRLISGPNGGAQAVRFSAWGWVAAGTGVFMPQLKLSDVTDIGVATVARAYFTVVKIA